MEIPCQHDSEQEKSFEPSPACWESGWVVTGWQIVSMGGFVLGFLTLDSLPKSGSLESPVLWCLAWKVQFKERIDTFSGPARCVLVPRLWNFSEKADGFRPPDQTEKGFL